MWRRGLPILGVLALGLGPAAVDARSAEPRDAPVRPTAFSSCASLVGYARRHFATTRGVVGPTVRPVAPPVAPPLPAVDGARPPTAVAAPAEGAAPGSSTTNIQEEGVDEPDLVKTDGSTIFTVSGTTLHAVAVAGGGAGGIRILGSLSLGDTAHGAQLMLHGTRLIVISGGGPVAVETPVAADTPVPLGSPVAVATPVARPASVASISAGRTVVREVDVHDPANMKVARSMTVDGAFVDARQNGATARIVMTSAPRALAIAGTRAQTAGWVPARRFHSSLTGRRYIRRVAPCRSIKRTATFSGLGMVSILTIDLDRGLWAADSDAVMADAQVVYGSQSSLYVATQAWSNPAAGVRERSGGSATAIHRFDVSDPERTTLAASGEVPGFLLNQFSLSELDGFLRVATTRDPIWVDGQAPGQSESSVTVLRQEAGRLAPVGEVSGLGRGERLYSVRFLGDRGYVVTFRQIDPLHVIDLAKPSAPRLAGELHLEGYSTYLHPIAGDLLLGVGQAVEGTRPVPSGTQLVLFDVRDAAAPKLLARKALGAGAWSPVETDHHAFLFWAPKALAVLPVQIHGASSDAPGEQFVGALGYRVDRSGITEVGRIAHGAVAGATPSISRSVVVGERVFTVSDAGVLASTLDGLAPQAFAAFPAGAPPG